jgi:thymidine kinase
MFTLYYGCMFAGKTTALLAEWKKATVTPSQIVVIKPAVDKRYEGNTAIVTHTQERLPAFPVSHAPEILTLITPQTNLVLIDELQFFDPQIVAVIQKLRQLPVTVIGAGLLLDYKKAFFGSMQDLLSISDQAIELFATCEQCGEKAMYTQRKIKSKALISPGGSEQYGPRCAQCYQVHIEKL